jgi:hypothetical protein
LRRIADQAAFNPCSKNCGSGGWEDRIKKIFAGTTGIL